MVGKFLSVHNFQHARAQLLQTHAHSSEEVPSATLTFSNGALHVAHDLAVLVVQELHADLGDLHGEKIKMILSSCQLLILRVGRKTRAAWVGSLGCSALRRRRERHTELKRRGGDAVL